MADLRRKSRLACRWWVWKSLRLDAHLPLFYGETPCTLQSTLVIQLTGIVLLLIKVIDFPEMATQTPEEIEAERERRLFSVFNGEMVLRGSFLARQDRHVEAMNFTVVQDYDCLGVIQRRSLMNFIVSRL